MKVIINNIGIKTLEGSTVAITSSISDPISYCSLSIVDTTSSFVIAGMQEILVLDDKKIPYPTANLALNPTMNPYTDYWGITTGSGQTISQNGGGGIIWTFSNAPTNSISEALVGANVVPGQTYTSSVTLTGASAVNLRAGVGIVWYDNSNAQISSNSTNVTVTNSTQTISYTAVAPANASFAGCYFISFESSATNSGSITFTNAQFEAQWFSTFSYPTPFCGPGQTNCMQVSFGFWIRQYRKFAGFI